MLIAASFLLQIQEDENPVVADYVTCVVHQVEKLYRAADSAETVAHAAMKSCKDKEPGLKASVRDDLVNDLVKQGMSVHNAERAADKQVGEAWTEYISNLERNAEETVVRFRDRLQPQ